MHTVLAIDACILKKKFKWAVKAIRKICGNVRVSEVNGCDRANSGLARIQPLSAEFKMGVGCPAQGLLYRRLVCLRSQRDWGSVIRRNDGTGYIEPVSVARFADPATKSLASISTSNDAGAARCQPRKHVGQRHTVARHQTP